MARKTVKRCMRPQCMEVYLKETRNKYCDCGALLQIAEIEYKEKRSDVIKKKAYLHLILDDDEVKYKLGSTTRIGRVTDSVKVDIDLTEYAGKDVSREHAVITKEKDGYYITNMSRNHSVRIIDQSEKVTAIGYGAREQLKSEYGILLSRKILLQFIEEK